MTTGAMTPAAGRPMGVRMRGGLTAVQTWTRRGPIWVLSDPMVRRYYYLLDEEYQLLRLLDPEATLQTLRERFEAGHPRRRLDGRRMQQLIARWHREGLVESRAPGQAEVLIRQRAEDRRSRRWQAWQNPLVIKLPGVDPNRWLPQIERAVRWMFSPAAVFASLVLIVIAVLITAARFATLLERLPTLETLATPHHLLVMLLTVAAVKILHELGHAVACQHFGAQTKEMGVLLFLMMPCLYCDVSDAWRLPRRSARLIISGAGIYVEVVLAAVATILWWLSHPGTFHTVCLTIMLMGSLNTVMINGNPLLRYDGYYLLSDALGIINLWERSRRRVAEVMASVIFALERREEIIEDRFTGRLLFVYGVLSIGYRWVVLAVMLTFLYRLLRPLDLGFVAIAAGVWLLWFSVVIPVVSWLQQMIRATMRRRRLRPLLSLAGCIAGLAVLIFVPLPHWMTAAAVVRPAEAVELFVSVPGRVEQIAAPLGSAVRQGELILRLVNAPLEAERLRLAGEIARAERWLDHLEARGATDSRVRSQVPAARAKRDDLVGQLKQLAEDLQRLELSAPRDGILLPVPAVQQRSAPGQLQTWTGQVLDASNRGAFLTTGTHVCSVAPQDHWQALLYVSQDHIERLHPGLKVRFRPKHLPRQVLDGSIEMLAKVNVDSIPPHVAESIALEASGIQTATPRPMHSIYQVQVAIPGPNSALLVNARGTATIWLPRRTAWELAGLWFAETFSF